MSAFLKPLFPGLIAVSLGACAAHEAALDGQWQGRAGEGQLALEFHPDGTAVMKISGAGHDSDYYCTWTVAADRIHLVHASGETAEFRIVSVSADELLLRVGAGSAETCTLRRVGASTAADGS